MSIGYMKFSVGGRKYIYDTSTNAIVHINDAVFLILDDYLSGGQEAVVFRHEKDIPPDDLDDAISWIDYAIESCEMLQPFQQKDFSVILDNNNIHNALSSGMRQMALNVTDQCNQRCKYCIYSGIYCSERTHDDSTMTWSIAEKSINYFLSHADRNQEKNISFYGGEPLLEWKLVKRCIEFIQNVNDLPLLDINLVTNGTLLTDKIIRYLIDRDVGLFISIDGPRPLHDTNRIFRSGSGTFDVVMKTIEKIRDYNSDYFRRRVLFNSTISQDTDILEIVDFFSTGILSEAATRINMIKSSDTEFVPVSMENREKRKSHLDVLLKRYLDSLNGGAPVSYPIIQHVFGDVFVKIADRRLGLTEARLAPRGLCIPGKSRLFVATDGTFHVCEKFCPPGYEIGNYKTGISYDKVQALLSEAVAMSTELCQECWAYRLCSQCFIHLLEKGKISIERKKQSCENMKEKLKVSLERFIYLWEHEPSGSESNRDTLHGHVAFARLEK